MIKPRRKAIVLGMDGATFDVLLPRCGEEGGGLPNVAALLARGAWGTLQSTTPPFSAQAWASMVTGKNPARHGVVDFWERLPGQASRPVRTTARMAAFIPGAVACRWASSTCR